MEPKVWECPKCGAPNRPGNGRCWNCGTSESAVIGVRKEDLDDFERGLEKLRKEYREEQAK